MRKILITLGTLMITGLTSTYPLAETLAQLEVPAYAKWGKLAMKETQSKYPNAKIIDYLHEYSESKDGSTTEKFKLWLKEDEKEFGVFIKITYITETEKVVNIEFQETTR